MRPIVQFFSKPKPISIAVVAETDKRDEHLYVLYSDGTIKGYTPAPDTWVDLTQAPPTKAPSS